MVHAVMKIPLRPSTPHNCPFLHRISSAIKNWHVKHKRGKADSAPLSLPGTAICFSKSRLPPCHSTRFPSFEATRFKIINTSALLSSRWCTNSWKPRLSRYPPLFLERFSVLTACRTAYETLAVRFHHHSIILPRWFYVTDQETGLHV
jgi:hypothetical protein